MPGRPVAGRRRRARRARRRAGAPGGASRDSRPRAPLRASRPPAPCATPDVATPPGSEKSRPCGTRSPPSARGAALLPLSAGTALISTAGALLLTGTTLSTGNDASLRGTAAGAAALAHFLATMPGVTADHLRYGLEASDAPRRPGGLGPQAPVERRQPGGREDSVLGKLVDDHEAGGGRGRHHGHHPLARVALRRGGRRRRGRTTSRRGGPADPDRPLDVAHRGRGRRRARSRERLDGHRRPGIRLAAGPRRRRPGNGSGAGRTREHRGATSHPRTRSCPCGAPRQRPSQHTQTRCARQHRWGCRPRRPPRAY